MIKQKIIQPRNIVVHCLFLCLVGALHFCQWQRRLSYEENSDSTNALEGTVLIRRRAMLLSEGLLRMMGVQLNKHVRGMYYEAYHVSESELLQLV